MSQLLRNVNLVSTNLNQTLEVSTIVLTMYDARTRLSVDVANEVRQHFSGRVCAVIPRTVRLSEAPSFGQPITVFDPTSRGAVAYRELAKEVSNGRRSGLGKGLSALIPSEATGESDSLLPVVPISHIRPNAYQPRSHFDEESMGSLAASIREVGLLQPVLVRSSRVRRTATS